jgi:hypothetical protein
MVQFFPSENNTLYGPGPGGGSTTTEGLTAPLANYLRLYGLPSTPENNGLAIDRSGGVDATTNLNTWLQSLVTNGDYGELGSGTFKTSATLNIAGGSSIRLEGNGPQSTVIKPTGNTYPTVELNLTVGSLNKSGWIKGIGVVGPSANPGTRQAGFLWNATTLAEGWDLDVINMDMAYDWINNCYNFNGYGLSCSRFGSCNVGINLRAGAQSGSDFNFYGSYLFPAWSAVCIAGNGGGYGFFGGQFGLTGTGSSTIGVITIGYDWVSNAQIAGMVNAEFNRIGIEGFNSAWAITGWGENQAKFRGMSFNNPTVGAGASVGILNGAAGTAMNNAQYIFDGCAAVGAFSGAHLGVTASTFLSQPVRQTNWYVPPAGLTANSVAVGPGPNGVFDIVTGSSS